MGTRGVHAQSEVYSTSHRFGPRGLCLNNFTDMLLDTKGYRRVRVYNLIVFTSGASHLGSCTCTGVVRVAAVDDARLEPQ